MKQITRTVTTFSIFASSVKVVDGKIETTDLSAIEMHDEASCDDKKALKEVQKKYGKDNQYVIRSIERKDVVYGIDFDVFMKNAKIIERPISQQKEVVTPASGVEAITPATK